MVRPAAPFGQNPQGKRWHSPSVLLVLDGLPFPAAAHIEAMCGGSLQRALLAAPGSAMWRQDEKDEYNSRGVVRGRGASPPDVRVPRCMARGWLPVDKAFRASI